MPSLTDHYWGMATESTYGTAVTVTRFYPWLEVDPSWDNRRRQAKGLQGGGGRRGPLSARSYLPGGEGTVKVKAELESKAGGLLFHHACGVSTVTAITGGTQQVFHPGLATGYLPSATVQVVEVMNDGTNWPVTYAGCTANKVTIEQPEDDIATIEVEFDAQTISTAIAAATVTWPASTTIYDAYQASAGFGGTLTAPTNTALATGLTAYADVREFKLEIDQGLDTGRPLGPTRSRPIAGIPMVKASGKVEFNANTLPVSYITGSQLPFYVTWTTTETPPTGGSQLQVVVPKLALTKGMPKIEPGKKSLIDFEGDCPNDSVNRDFYLVYRTSDVAL